MVQSPIPKPIVSPDGARMRPKWQPSLRPWLVVQGAKWAHIADQSTPSPQTPNPKPQTPNPKLQTPNPKPQTPNPKPQTQTLHPNPKPQTLNPKP